MEIKKTKKSGLKAVLTICSTLNNTNLTLADESGNVLFWVSTGVLGFKGARKKTPHAAQMITELLIKKLKNFRIRELDFKIRGLGNTHEVVTDMFEYLNFEINSVTCVNSAPHNGCRPRKVRKV